MLAKTVQGEKRVTEDETAGCHHQVNGHESEQILGDSEGQGSLACCSPWGSQRVGHELASEQQQQRIKNILHNYLYIDIYSIKFINSIKLVTSIKWKILLKLKLP